MVQTRSAAVFLPPAWCCWGSLGAALVRRWRLTKPARWFGPNRLLEMSEGEITTLDIIIENAKDVYGIDARGGFDPAIIEVIDADPNKEGVQIKPGAFPKPDFLVRNEADNQGGTFQYVTTQLNPTSPASGSGVVFSVQFRGKAVGETALTIDSVQMADRLGRALAVSAASGKIRVVQSKSLMSSPTTTPPAPSPALSPPHRRAWSLRQRRLVLVHQARRYRLLSQVRRCQRRDRSQP